MAVYFPSLLTLPLIAAVALILFPVSLADDGTASFYTAPYVPSSCFGYEDNGVIIAAASDVIWNNRGACGKYFTVTCTGGTNQGVPQPCKGGSVVVKIVDYCPNGCRGRTIDLSQEAFSQIANTDAGVITISYQQQ